MDTEINYCFYFLKMLADEGYLGGRNLCVQTCILCVCVYKTPHVAAYFYMEISKSLSQ